MIIILHANFKKRYKKLRFVEKKKFKERRSIFLQNPFHLILNNHPLQGKYKGYRSINITGDLRAIYKNKNGSVIFVDIDTHSNLFS